MYTYTGKGCPSLVLAGFNATQWNLAKDTINEFLKQKSMISSNVYQTISDIYNSVFSKEIIFIDEKNNYNNSDISGASINSMNIAIDQFDKIMNEIDDETKEQTKYSKKSNNSYHVFDKDRLVRKFCSDEPRDVQSKLKPNSLAANYKLVLSDYLSINEKLIYGELKDLLIKHSKNNKYHKQDLNHLYHNIKHERNICSLFRIHGSDFEPEYISMMNMFEQHENDTLKMFCMIFYGILHIFLTKQYTHDYKRLIKKKSESIGKGFDAFIYHHGGSLTELLKEYIINHIAQTGVFDTQKKRFISRPNTKITNDELKETQSSNEDILLSIKQALFTASNDEFTKLVEYCTQDIQSGKTNKFKSIYQIVANDCYRGDRPRGDDILYKYGISCFIINRLSYLVFSELIKYETNNKNEKQLLFPSLIKFYKFIHNWSIYVHCYIPMYARSPLTESFCIREYYNLTKYKWYKINIGCTMDMQLKHVHYLYGNTLLHSSIGRSYNYYSKLLIRDTFDCMHENDEGKTPFGIAQSSENAFILSLMNASGQTNYNTNANVIMNKMDDKSIELRYNSFMDQSSFSKYFLHKIGINYEHEKKTDDEDNIEQGDKTRAVYNSKFYVSFKDLVGLKSDNDINDAVKTMKDIVDCVLSLLKLKVVISDDLLVLCGIYDCNTIASVLISIIEECVLIGQYSNKKDEEFATRNYIWFEHYLLDSNVWFVKYKSNQILFDQMSNVVEQGLIKQKKFIWDNFDKEKKVNARLFNELCMLDITNHDSKHDPDDIIINRKSNTRLRQDKILNGIKPERNELSILLLESEVGNNSKDGGSAFNVSFENNTKVYSTQCLTFAHANNNRLQNEMKEYFSFSNINIKCDYQAAPVKTYDRILVKATSDYGNEEYPSVANILDFMRFSVTFDNMKDLLTGVNKFIADINNDKMSCLESKNGILRIKNGFKDIAKHWKSFDDARYCDIKFNIVYNDKSTNQRMIIEVQFLLSFLLEAKKMSHKLYDIIRKQDFINNIKNQIYNIDTNGEKFKMKIRKLMQNNDTINLTKHLFWRPNVILSTFFDTTDYDNGGPLLYHIGRQFANHREIVNLKFVLFFLNCLFHFSYILLNEPNDKNNKWLSNYFNIGKHSTIHFSAVFFGIDVSYVSLIELIMKQTYFDGLNEAQDRFLKEMLITAIRRNDYEYLELQSKYFGKNSNVVKKCINYNKHGGHPMSLFREEQIDHFDDVDTASKFLKLYLNFSLKCEQKIDEKELSRTVECLSKHDKYNSLQQMIIDYIENAKI